jgi:hypothetical protein
MADSDVLQFQSSLLYLVASKNTLFVAFIDAITPEFTGHVIHQDHSGDVQGGAPSEATSLPRGGR